MFHVRVFDEVIVAILNAAFDMFMAPAKSIVVVPVDVTRNSIQVVDVIAGIVTVPFPLWAN